MRYSLSLIVLASIASLSLALELQRGAADPGSDSASGEAPSENSRVELGEVDWLRDFEAAKKRAREHEKPLFVLFTEVPGCSTVRSFGRGPLSDPIVVDAIESHFVPVAIFNNVEGEDREVLKSFGEPSWNNPVVRIVRPDRSALADRFAGTYTTTALLGTISEALERAEGDVPTYLKLRHRELASRGHRETALFGMYCFWSGEAALGRLEGVVRTRPGFLEGSEVVRVTYDTRRTSYETLVEAATSGGAAERVYARSEVRLETAESVVGDAARSIDGTFQIADDDRKYHLRHSRWRSIEMTELQRTRVNSALEAGESPLPYLSPAQRREVDAEESGESSPHGTKQNP